MPAAYKIILPVIVSVCAVMLTPFSACAQSKQFPYDPLPFATNPTLEPNNATPLEMLKANPSAPIDKAPPPMDRVLPAFRDKTGEKRLHLHSLHTGETVNVVFWRNGYFVTEGLSELKHLLRDHRSGDEIDMDPKLFSLLYQLYADLGGKGAIHIISGHRSAKTNAMLKSKGRNVAKKSQHVLGTAMDIRIPGVPLELLRKTALAYKAGGVGYYPQNDFIHIDTGRPRQW